MANIIEFLEARIAEETTGAAQVTQALLRLHTFAERDMEMEATGRRELRYHGCMAWGGENPEPHFGEVCETLQVLAAAYSDHPDYARVQTA